MDRPSSLARVVTAGQRSASPLHRRVLGLDGESRMPEEGPPLAPDEVELLGRWIDAGAPGLDTPDDPGSDERTRFWSYLPPVRPALPGGSGHPVDAFIDAALARAGLSPAPPAGRETLIRRVTLDLTGLPPTLAEIDAFIHDPRPDAYWRWWTDCWPRRTSASAGRCPGWTPPATPTATGTRRTPPARCGATATGW